MEPPVVGRSTSIGNATTNTILAAGQAATEDGEMVDGCDFDDEPTWLSGHGETRLTLAPAPESQEDGDDDDMGDDDRKLELLKEKYETLNSKTYRITELWMKKHKLMEEDIPDPKEKMKHMRDGIDSMPEDDNKNNSMQMYNAVASVFKSAQQDPALLDFVADIFPKQRAFNNARVQEKEWSAEIRMLNNLYEEQDLKKNLEELAKFHANRRKSQEEKGAAKAARDAAKEEAKSAKKSRKSALNLPE